MFLQSKFIKNETSYFFRNFNRTGKLMEARNLKRILYKFGINMLLNYSMRFCFLGETITDIQMGAVLTVS